jgi:hypothetical protein
MGGMILPFPRAFRTAPRGSPFGLVRIARDWWLHPDQQPKRIRELARAGLSVDAIALLTAKGTLEIKQVIAEGRAS